MTLIQAPLDAGHWDFHAARVLGQEPCEAEGCGHRLDAHWHDDTIGLSCDVCCAYCEAPANQAGGKE